VDPIGLHPPLYQFKKKIIFNCVNFFFSFGEDEHPTFNPSSADGIEQYCDKYESSTLEFKTLPNGASPAEEHSDPVSDRHAATEVASVTNM
jgi:hypothetical protein